MDVIIVITVLVIILLAGSKLCSSLESHAWDAILPVFLSSFSIPEQEEPHQLLPLTDSREGQVQADTAVLIHKVLHKSANTALGDRDPSLQPASCQGGFWRLENFCGFYLELVVLTPTDSPVFEKSVLWKG